MFHYLVSATLSIIVLHGICVAVDSLLLSENRKELVVQKKLTSFLHKTVKRILLKPESTTRWILQLEKMSCSLRINTHLEIKKCFKGMQDTKHSIEFSTKTSVGLNWEWHTMLYSEAFIVTCLTMKWLNKADRGIICSMLTAQVPRVFFLQNILKIL